MIQHFYINDKVKIINPASGFYEDLKNKIGTVSYIDVQLGKYFYGLIFDKINLPYPMPYWFTAEELKLIKT